MRASVIVTMPSRGSLTWRSTKSATISRTRTLMRRARSSPTEPLLSAFVPMPDEASPGGQQVDLRSARHQALAPVEHLVAVRRIGRHDRDTQQRPPVQIEMTGLGGGHLEPATQLGHDRTHDRPLLLE